MTTYRCCRCRQHRPAPRFTPSERARGAKGMRVVCVQCKSEGQLVPNELRKEGDPGLMDCYRATLDRDVEDERGMGLLPASIMGKRAQRIAEYAAEVERHGMAGDGRRWA